MDRTQLHSLLPHQGQALWLDALLLTVSGHDKQFNESIRGAWREVLNKGISVIKAGY